jgi:hypothetical protein
VSHDRRLLLLDRLLAKTAASVDVGAEHDAHGIEQPLAIVGRYARERSAIVSDLFEELGGVAHAVLQRVVDRALGWFCQWHQHGMKANATGARRHARLKN